MSDTPDTDAKSFIAFDTEGRKLVVVLATTSESIERERDGAQSAYELMSARAIEWEKRWLAENAKNAKLRDIAERIFAAGVGRMKTDDWRTLRAEFDQLKEGAK